MERYFHVLKFVWNSRKLILKDCYMIPSQECSGARQRVKVSVTTGSNSEDRWIEILQLGAKYPLYMHLYFKPKLSCWIECHTTLVAILFFLKLFCDLACMFFNDILNTFCTQSTMVGNSNLDIKDVLTNSNLLYITYKRGWPTISANIFENKIEFLALEIIW